MLQFKMSISQLWLSENNSIFQQVIISFSVIKQQIINDVHQFASSFLNFDFYIQWSYTTQYTVTVTI